MIRNINTLWVAYFLWFGLGNVGLTAHASSIPSKIYEWLEGSIENIRVVENPKVEYEIEKELVGLAQSSVDIVTFDIRLDPKVGIPFLNALREAADRGVQVRLVSPWVSKIQSDFLGSGDPFEDQVANYLLDPPTAVPIQYVLVGGPAMARRGWAISDAAHEKLFIVDGRWAIMTGRGHSDSYLNFLDSAILIKWRGLVEQVQDVFNEIWQITREENGLQRSSGEELDFATTHRNQVEVPLMLSDEEERTVKTLKKWLRRPQGIGGRACRARMLHHNFLFQMKNLAIHHRKAPYRWSWEERFNAIRDPIVEEVIRLIGGLKQGSLEFTSIVATVPPKLKEVLIDLMNNRGLKVSIFTNSRETHDQAFPFFPSPWYASLEDIRDLFRIRNPNLVIRAFHPAKAQPANARLAAAGEGFHFLHRKIVIVGSDIVLLGSSNMNTASTVSADEAMVEIESAVFAESMRQSFWTGATTYGVDLNPDEVLDQKEVAGTGWRQWFAQLFKGLM